MDLDGALVEAVVLRNEVVDPGSRRLTEWVSCELASCVLASTSWTRARFADTLFDDCDLANARLERSAAHRVVLERSRLTGLDASGSDLLDVDARHATADRSSWRGASVERARFEDCGLASSDWTGARLRDVSFIRCDLTGADFTAATMERVSFEACVLAGLNGVDGLRGARVDSANLVDLAAMLAGALGIEISGGEPSP